MNQKGTVGQVIKCLLMALLAGMVVTILGSMLTATLISGEKAEESASTIGAAVSLLLGGISASIIAAGTYNKNRAAMCFAGGGAYFLGLLCCAATLFGGVQGSVVMTLLVIAGASLCGVLLSAKKGKKTKYKLPKSLR